MFIIFNHKNIQIKFSTLDQLINQISYLKIIDYLSCNYVLLFYLHSLILNLFHYDSVKDFL